MLMAHQTLVGSNAVLSRVKAIAADTNNPELALKKLGPLISMGNATLADAQIIFIPEVHDDPKSQLVQLMLIAQEKEKNRPFIVLDESLESLDKSSWEIFSQKTLEILAAEEHRKAKKSYSPRDFEASLQNLASKFREHNGDLSYSRDLGFWTLAPFFKKATPFYGWDLGQRDSLTERNVQMTKTLAKLLTQYNRIIVMLGARHVPELEYFTSQQLICPEQRQNNIDDFYALIEKKYGLTPDLSLGIGSTAPIYRFLKDKKYVLVFSKKFYDVLKEVVADFKGRSSQKSCVEL